MDVNTQMITIHPRISVLIYFIYTNMNNRIIVNHPRCKHHPKIPTRVTPLYIQSFTTIHKKIHPYALVHKSLPRQPATWLLLHFLHSYIINTQTHFVTSFTKIHKFLTTWQHHVTFLKTQDGDVPAIENTLVDYFHNHSTLIADWVHYTAILNDLSLQKYFCLIYCLQSSLRILKSMYLASNIVIN